MQTGYDIIGTHLAETYTSKPVARVRARFNNNRFADTLTVNATEQFSDFPKDSVVGRARPGSGLPFGVIGYARVRRETSTQTKFRVAGPEARYKYWRSPQRSAGTAIDANIEVVHSAMRANTLRAQFETHAGSALPTTVQVWYRQANAWVSAGTFSPTGAGLIELYRQYDGTWNTTYTEQYPLADCQGIKLQVTQMSASGVYCDVVELASLYALDISADVEKFNLSVSSGDVSPMNPVGAFSSNELSVSLDNSTYRYSDTNAASDLQQYIDSEAELLLDTGYTINGFDYYVSQGKYWVDSWNPSESSATVEVQADDFSRFLQKQDMHDTIFVGNRVSVVVRELLAQNGFLNASISIDVSDRDFVVPFVWFEEGTTVWEAITSVVGADHGMFYVDKSNNVRYRSKRELYQNQTSVLDLTTHTESGNRPNLFSLEREWQQTFNKVRVGYEVFKENVAFDDKSVINSELWSPGDDVALRSAPLLMDVVGSGNFGVNIGKDEIEVWPYEGAFNIEGEIFKYKGKWVTSGGTNAIKYNEDEYKTWTYTGNFANVERAQDGSAAAEHRISLLASGVRAHSVTGPSSFNANAATESGKFVLSTNPANGYNTWHTYMRGISSDSYQIYGTKLKFPPLARGRRENMAGLLIHRQSTDSPLGYYIELGTTANAVARNIGNVRCYKGGQSVSTTNHFVRPDDPAPGHFRRPEDLPVGQTEMGLKGLPQTAEGIRGYDIAVDFDEEVQLDVVVVTHNGTQNFSVFVNGVFVCAFADDEWTQGLFGVFARGSTLVQFEYLYTWSTESIDRFVRDVGVGYGKTVLEAARFQDRINGSYSSGYAAALRSGASGWYKWFFDEFAPEVHERKHFDVRHNISPAFSNFVLSTNPLVSITKLYTTPFKTRFTIENASRDFELAHGSSAVTSLNNVLNVYGQALIREEKAYEEVNDEQSIRKHGVHEYEVESPWIQSQEHAHDIADFIADKWGEPLDFVSADIVYDPRLEVGDCVLIDDPEGTFHSKKFFITSIDVGWAEGFNCGLTLRRVH